MIQRIEQLKTIHNAFFQGDERNFKTMILGFTISAACMLAIFGIYQI